MSFTGDLEHLSIVDVVQLLHATRKSGTLTVTGRKGSAQLVFSDGYIVSAGHFDERLRIGAILVEAGVLARQELDRALAEQAAAGDRRRPLIATLIESGRVKKADAFRGLESLIEMTIVDILTWQSGSFTLDVGAVLVSDEYRYFPEKLSENVQFHTENILMEALRIYDEKKRDGKLQGSESAVEEAPGVVALTEELEVSLSPEDLGLGDVERLERRIPGVFQPISDRPAVSPHRAAIAASAPDLPAEAQDLLVAFLEGLPSRPAGLPGIPLAVVLLGASPLLAHCLTAVCRHEGFSLFVTTDLDDVLPVAEQHRGKGAVPILVLDRGGPLAALPAAKLPLHLGCVELTDGAPLVDEEEARVRSVLRTPVGREADTGFAPALVRFLESFPAVLGAHAREQGAWAANATRRCALRLSQASEASAVVQAVLATVAELGARALALLPRGEELTTTTSIDLHLPGGDVAPSPALRIPLAQAPLAQRVLERGGCLIAPAADDGVRELLQAALGPPADPLHLLIPLSTSGKTVSLIYADFGSRPALPPPADLLETIAALARGALELVLCRKRLEKTSR